jgi:tetratricopeptide (TPR) repeat protein
VFFVDASSYQSAAEEFRSIAQILKLPTSTLPARNIDTVRQCLSAKAEWLLVIDNADDPYLDIGQFFPPGNNGTILITTRNPGFTEHSTAGSISVEQMSKIDAEMLLTRISGLENKLNLVEPTAKDKSQMAAIESVVATLGCLALAIIQAGAVIRQNLVPLEGFCSLYSQRRKELLELGSSNFGNEHQRSVHTTWEISISMIEAVKEPHTIFALELLNLFSFMHFDGIAMSMLERARHGAVNEFCQGTTFSETFLVRGMPDGWDAILAAKALKVLVSYSLVTVDDSGCISMHPLVHQWSRERMEQSRFLQAWNTSTLIIAVATPWICGVKDMPFKKIMLPHIDSCLSQGRDNLFLDGSDIQNHVFAALVFARAYMEHYRGDGIVLSMKSLDCIEKYRPIGCGYHLNAVEQVARDLTALGRYKEGLEVLERGFELEAMQSLEMSEGKALLVLLLGELLNANGQPQRALDTCEGLRKPCLSELGEGDHIMIQALETIGWAKHGLGNPKDAITCLEDCLRLRAKYHSDSGKKFTRFEPLRQLAVIYCEVKQVKKAITVQTEYLKRSKETFGDESLQTILARAVLGAYKAQCSFSVVKSRRFILKGLPMAREALKTETHGEITVIALTCMDQVVESFYLCGALHEALDLGQEVLRLATQKFGEAHNATIEYSEKVAHFQKLLRIKKAIFWWLPRKILERG